MNFARYGFTTIDAKVQTMANNIMSILLSYVIMNAMYVIKACNCKTLKASHLEAVQNILKYYLNQSNEGQNKKASKQSGGFTVMASEYYTAIQSGSFFNDVTFTSPLESGEDVTRGSLVSTFPGPFGMSEMSEMSELPSGMFGGGSSNRGDRIAVACAATTTGFVTKATISKLIKDMNVISDIRVSKDALEVITASINATMDSILQKARVASKDSKNLSYVKFVKAAKEIKHIKVALAK
jgi:hypothetical protein